MKVRLSRIGAFKRNVFGGVEKCVSLLFESAMKISTTGVNLVVHLAIFSLAFSYPWHKVQRFKSKFFFAQIK